MTRSYDDTNDQKNKLTDIDEKWIRDCIRIEVRSRSRICITAWIHNQVYTYEYDALGNSLGYEDDIFYFFSIISEGSLHVALTQMKIKNK
jgi:hypothetical protein